MTKILAFRTPENEAEERQLFRLIEDRGERVLVEALSTGLPIPPTFVYWTADMVDVTASYSWLST